MPNKLVELYREYLAKNGQTDDRDDSFIIEELGELAKKDAPELFDAFPDFSRDWADVREANAPSLGAETGRAFKRASIGLGSTALGGAALLTGSDYLKRKAAAVSLQASDPDLAATIPTLEDIQSPRDALRYGASKVGEVLPSLGEAVGVGLAGAAVGSTVGPGGTLAGGFLGRAVIKRAIQGLVTKGMSEAVIEAGLRKGVPEIVAAVAKNAASIAKVGGGTAAAAVNSYVLNSGEVYGENDDRATAMGLGLISAIPDTVLPALVVRRLFPGVTLPAGRAAAKQLVGKNAIRVAEAAGLTTFEGGTEAFQEAVNIVARNLKENIDPFTVTAADKIRIREAGITGAFGGALASPAVVLGGAEDEVVVPDRPEPLPVSPPAPVAPQAPVVPPVVSPVRRVLAMTPEQQTERLAELEANTARTPDEEEEYQNLLAVAPRPAAVLPTGESPAGAGETGAPPAIGLPGQEIEFPEPPPPAEPTPLPRPTPGAPPATGLPGQEIEFAPPPAAAVTPVVAPAVAVEPTPAAADISDYDRYQQIQAQMRSMIPDNTDSQAFQDLWRENEQIKNRNKGMPPTAPVAPESPAVVPVVLPLPTAKPKRKWGRFGSRSDGVVDIIDAIQDTGGVPRPGPRRGGEFDGFEEVFGGRLKSLVSKSVGGWDTYMQALVGVYPQFASLENATAGEIGDVVNRAIEDRARLKREMTAQRITGRFEERALGGISKKAGKPVAADGLVAATKFKVGGVPFEVSGIQEDGSVIVKDGPEYGQQVIPPGAQVFPDKNTLRRAKVSTDFLGEEQLAPEAAPPLPPLPTNVIPQNEIPWNLLPEVQKDAPSAIKLAEDAAAIKAEQDKQTDMFNAARGSSVSGVDPTAPNALRFRDARPDEITATDRQALADMGASFSKKLGQQVVFTAVEPDAQGIYRGEDNSHQRRQAGSLHTDRSAADPVVQREVRMAELRGGLQQALGKRIIFFDTSIPIQSWGLHSELSPNTLLVNASSPTTFSAVVGHELGHDMERGRKDLYDTLSRLVLGVAPMQPSYAEGRKAYGYATADLQREYVNDVIGDRFSEPEFWTAMGAEAQRTGVADKFRQLLEWVYRWLGLRAPDQTQRGDMSVETRTGALPEIDRIRQAVAQAIVEFTGAPPTPVFRTSTEPTNPAVQAQRTKQFQVTMGRLVSNGADVQAMSRELLVQQTGEVLQQQITALQTRLAAATTTPQRNAIQRQLDIRAQRLSEIEQMSGVTYSPYHIAIAMDDVMNASVNNLVTLLHEAAESLTMRLGVEMQGAVFRAVEKTTDEMTAKMQAAAKNTGATIANVGEPGELLAESLAQQFAAEGIPESTSLADAIVRWIKEIYYRVAMAAQRAFGAEPNVELALAWYENQLRRELGGDYEYSFANLLDRFLPLRNIDVAQTLSPTGGTHGNIVDFFDPVTQKLRQPWMEPTNDEALEWNMRFQTVPDNVGESDGIPAEEAADRIAAAAYNDEIAWLEAQRKELDPSSTIEDFARRFGRGAQTPMEMLARIETRRPGVSTAKIGGTRMTDAMNKWAAHQALVFMQGVQEKHLSDIAKLHDGVAKAEDSFTEHRKELNRLEPDVRNAELHEGELKKRARTLVESTLKSYANGLRVSTKLGEMVANEESLGPKDPLPQFYRDVFNNLLKGEVPLFEYIEAIALLDMPLGNMTPAEIWKAIRDNADTSTKLRELSRNKPLALTTSVMARDGARQVDQIQLRRADGQTFIDIRAELEGVRNATEAQLRVMLKTIDEKNTKKGLRQRIKTEYLKERRALQRQSDRIAAADERITLLEKAKPAVAAKVEELEQTVGGLFGDWSPSEGKEFFVMREGDDGEWTRGARKLAFASDGSSVDWRALENDMASNRRWLTEKQELRGTKRYNEVEQQTYALGLLDISRKYPAANYAALNIGFLKFGELLKRVDSIVRPISAIPAQAGHSSGARIQARFNQYDFITRMAEPLSAHSLKWTHAFQALQKSTGIEDNGKFLSQLYNPVMFFLGVNPGLNEAQAIRAANKQARQRLTKEPSANFDEQFERFLKATKEVNDALLKIAEEYGLFVSDPKLKGELRRALARGWLTGMRSMDGATVRTLITDMEKAGWKLAFDTDEKGQKAIRSIKAVTFADLDAESVADADVLRNAVSPYFTAGIINRWLEPFINKPGESVFNYGGEDISQLDLQAAWDKSGGDVIAWIDALGERLGVAEEGANQATEGGAEIEGDVDESAGEEVDNTATFRLNMLRQIDRLFAWEARMAYDSNQAPDLTDPQGAKPHVFMDARANDLMPAEHVKFASFDPTSTRQMLTQIAYHAAFGRNAKALAADLAELEGILKGKRDAFNSLRGTTVDERKREAVERGYDYDEIKTGAASYDDVMALVSKIKAATGMSNPYGMLHDARVTLELTGFLVGQAVDRPTTAALNLLSLGQRPFVQHSLGLRTVGATLASYADFLKTGFGGFMRSVGLDLVKESEYEAEVGEILGLALRDVNWGVAISDIGREGKFQETVGDKYVIRPLRALRSIQKKGVGFGPFVAPGLGVMNRIQAYATIAGTMQTIKQVERAIDRGIQYFASHPEDLNNPAFKFDYKTLRMDKPVHEWFSNKTVEYGMGTIERMVRESLPRQTAGQRLLTKEQVLKFAQMTSQEFDGASSVNTAPAWMSTNPASSFFIPLLRWPLWMMHAAHKALADNNQKTDFKSMVKGLGIMAAWNLPLGLAFTFMLDEYDEKILGRKNALPESEKIGAIPVVGPLLALATTDRPLPKELLAMGQRLMRAGNTYGLAAELAGQFIVPFDPASGQRTFSMDQRILVMSHLMNIQQAMRNLVAQDWTATWGSVWRPFVSGIGGNGVIHGLDLVNRATGLDNAEARMMMRINAQRWVNAAAREAGIETKGITSFGTPSALSVQTREMQMAAMANDRMGFMEAYQQALEAARGRVSKDDRIPAEQREREATQRVLQSWRTRNPFSGLQATPTQPQIQLLLSVMDDSGRSDVQDAMRLYETYTQFIAPSPMERYLNARIRPPQNPFNQIERMRRQAAGMMFAP